VLRDGKHGVELDELTTVAMLLKNWCEVRSKIHTPHRVAECDPPAAGAMEIGPGAWDAYENILISAPTRADGRI
jgi:hypothetical protein